MSRKKEIIKDAGMVVLFTILTQAITLLAAIMSRRFLGPYQTGVWGMIQVVLTYAGLSALGTTNAIAREIPFYIGKKDPQHANCIKNVVFSFSVFSSFIVGLLIIGGALIGRPSLSTEMFWALVLAALVVLLQRINDLFITLLRAYKVFSVASKQMLYSAVVNVFLVILLSYQFNLYGFILANILSLIFNILYMVFSHNFRLSNYFNWKITVELIRYGFPLMVLGLLAQIFLSIDRIMVAKWLGLETLGVYGVAILAANYLSKIPTSIGIVLLPNFHEKYGERESKKDLLNYIIKSASAISTCIPLPIAVVWFFSPVLLQIMLPEFAEVLPTLQILILSPFFMALANPFENFLIAIKKQRVLFWIMGISCLTAIGLNLAALKAGWEIEGIALATTVTFAAKIVMMFAATIRAISDSSWDLANCMIRILIKFIWMIISLWLSQSVFWFFDGWSAAILGTLFFCVLQGPLYYRFINEFSVFEIFRQKFISPQSGAADD